MQEKKLISFDIFDTLITRNTEPKDVFLLMQKSLLTDEKFNNISSVLKNDFVNIRCSTEDYVRENLRIHESKKEINFCDIYNCIKNNFNLSDYEQELFQSLELKIEKENLYPIHKNIELLKQYLGKGFKVILISDMYFPENILRDFLIQFDDIFAQTDIYVSTDFNLKKLDGSIFKYIKQQLKPEYWLHIGDNFKSDVFMPQINGIKTKQYKAVKLKQYEKYLLSQSDNDINIKLSIGCAKKLRLSNNNQKYQFGCSFAGAVLYNYVKWVLEQCISRNIKHLYFVARDGYILQKIADAIIQYHNLDLKTHYFCTSRLACKNTKKYNQENLLESYLLQEIDNLEDKVAFIDINGSGKTQDYITEVLNRNRYCKTYNFYLHNKTTMKQNNLSEKLFMIPKVDLHDWVEYLCRCPQGQTIGYKLTQEGMVIPEKEQINDKFLINWGIEDYIQGVLDYTKEILDIEKQNNIKTLNVKHSILLNKYMYSYLDKETADIIGSISFAVEGKETKIKEVAPKINIFNLFCPKHSDYIAIARCNPFLKPLFRIIKTIINPRTYAFINKDKKLAYIKFFGLRIDISKLLWREIL